MENKKCQTFVIELINKHLAFFFCDSAGTQTQDPQLRRLLLYSAELPNQILLGLMHKNFLWRSYGECPILLRLQS